MSVMDVLSKVLLLFPSRSKGRGTKREIKLKNNERFVGLGES